MKLIRILAVIVLVALIGSSWMIYNNYQSFLERPLQVPDGGVVVDIKKGQSYRGMVSQLVETGLTQHEWPWRLLHRLEPGVIQAGEYQIDPGMNPRDWLERLAEGDVINYRFTIIEGWSFRQLRAALEKHEILGRGDVPLEDQELLRALSIDADSVEGWFLPETYTFARGTTDFDVLKMAHEAMTKAVGEAWATRQPDIPLATPYELMTLASIIEKETGIAAERREIAGVFVRRLEKNMRLQTDPTVIYGLGESFDGDIRYRDLRTDTPYNTYTRDGLPPTPIAMPGVAALNAAANPADGTALYFVATGDGGHYFSDTLAEHNQAVNRYQRGQP